MLRNWGLCLFTLFMGVILAVFAAVPPPPQGESTALDQFSSARAMVDVREIAQAPHPTGSPDSARVVTYLSERLAELGMSVSIDEGQLTERALTRLNRWSGDDKSAQTLHNVIGVLPGSDRSKPALLLMAHHDTVWGSPGAADDTIGIASILEISRAVTTAENRKRDLIILFTDAEELGLVGAAHFFESHPLKDTIGTVINFEARGGGGTANMFQTSASNGQAAKLYARFVSDPSASSLSIFVYNILPNDTDLTPALKKDYIAYNIANIGRAEYYHSPKITPNVLAESTLQHMGSQGLDLTRALLAADVLPGKAPDVTFFDVFGFFTVLYPAFWGWVFIAVAALFYALSLKGDVRPREILSGSLAMLGFLVIGGGALYGLNILSGSHNTPNYYDRLAAIHQLEAVALFLVLAAFFALFGRAKLSVNKHLGMALPLFILGFAGQALAPTASYFISLALLFCSITSLVLSRPSKTAFAPVILCVSSGVVFGYMLFLGHFLMLGVGPDMLAVAILPAAIAALAITPLYQGLSTRLTQSLAIAAAATSIGIALWVRLDPIAATVPLY